MDCRPNCPAFFRRLTHLSYGEIDYSHDRNGVVELLGHAAKKDNRALPIEALFAPDQAKPALIAIADAAAAAWAKTYTARSGQKPGPNADMAKDGIGADAEKLKTYVLTYAKGQVTANGIVLLYGAGEVWPHVLGDFRLSIPAAVFAKYLAPQWKTLFGAATR